MSKCSNCIYKHTCGLEVVEDVECDKKIKNTKENFLKLGKEYRDELIKQYQDDFEAFCALQELWHWIEVFR